MRAEATSRRLRFPLAGLVLGALLATAPGLAADPEPVRRMMARSGDVVATVTYRSHDFIRLKITRRGKTLRDTSIRRIPGCDVCYTAASLAYAAPLLVRDLNDDREPEVVLSLWSGGASCCDSSLIFYFASDRYRFTIGFWARWPYKFGDFGGDGRVEIVSRDGAFYWVFTDPLRSAPPIQIWRFQEGKLIDVTRRFPELIERHSRALLRWYEKVRRNKSLPDVRGVLAGWVAEQYLLGRERAGWRFLEGALRRGELSGEDLEDAYPTGRKYLRELRMFLGEHGYAPR